MGNNILREKIADKNIDLHRVFDSRRNDILAAHIIRNNYFDTFPLENRTY
jgi:hypothetical protein